MSKQRSSDTPSREGHAEETKQEEQSAAASAETDCDDYSQALGSPGYAFAVGAAAICVVFGQPLIESILGHVYYYFSE